MQGTSRVPLSCHHRLTATRTCYSPIVLPPGVTKICFKTFPAVVWGFSCSGPVDKRAPGRYHTASREQGCALRLSPQLAPSDTRSSALILSRRRVQLLVAVLFPNPPLSVPCLPVVLFPHSLLLHTRFVVLEGLFLLSLWEGNSSTGRESLPDQGLSLEAAWPVLLTQFSPETLCFYFYCVDEQT